MALFSSASASALPPPLDVIPPRSWSPDRSEASWWAALPIGLVVALFIIGLLSPDFYRAYVLPEGYGFLELSQFLMMVAGFILCVQMLRPDVVRQSRLLRIAMLFFALATFYIAGEEHSWGQHFFNWNTPGYWAEVNRQEETNLHNVSPWFNQRPKVVFDLAILIGGLIVPLVQRATGRTFQQPLLALLTPPFQLVFAALAALLFKVIGDLGKHVFAVSLFIRPSEAVETFEYMFVLFFLIVLRRRIRALESAGVKQVTL